MFFHVKMTRFIELPPSCFYKNMKREINQRLLEDVEGTCQAEYGYIVCVTEVEEIGDGRIRDDIPEVSFPVEFRAIVFRPFKNEVLDGVVTQMDQFGIFVEVGPLQVYVSDQQIPSDYTLNTDLQPHWAYEHNEDPELKITIDTEVRMKLMNVRIELTEMAAVGTLNVNYMGPLD